MRFISLLLLLVPLCAQAIIIKNNADIKVQVFIEYKAKYENYKFNHFCYHRPHVLPTNSINIHLSELCGLTTLNGIRFGKIYAVANNTGLIEYCHYSKFNNDSSIIITGGHEDDIRCSA